MNRRHRQEKKKRAQAHQRLMKARKQERTQLELKPIAKAPSKPRKRPLPKRRIRAMGRKLRPEPEPLFQQEVFRKVFGVDD